MSAPSSPPGSPAYVPYQAYKSKRHSRNLSAPNAHVVPNQVLLKQFSAVETASLSTQPPTVIPGSGSNSVQSYGPRSAGTVSPSPSERESNASMAASSNVGNDRPTVTPRISTPLERLNDSHDNTLDGARDSVDCFPSPAPSPSHMYSNSRKVTTLRRLHPKRRTVQPSVPASDPSVPSSPLTTTLLGSDLVGTLPSPELMTPVAKSTTPTIPSIEPSPAPLNGPESQAAPSLSQVLPSFPPAGGAVAERSPMSSLSSPLKAAPYRPGFQPRGLYRSLTDDFLAIRKAKRDGDSVTGLKRIERAKLERRLEKLILLHFPHIAGLHDTKEGSRSEERPSLRTVGRDQRRTSSFFDFQSFNHLSLHSPGEIWKGVIAGGLDSTKADIRAAEQRITPWQDDVNASKCPLCSAVFHPLTNRKHHCRLCGQIICSLPPKSPQRPTPCSVLFIVDSQTCQIEEVDEGVDYGVRRRKQGNLPGSQKDQEEEKYLKGVRICRECRPILLRQKYLQQAQGVPIIVKLYEAGSPIYPNLIALEGDIEESLPKFQELILTLSHNALPTKEASTARKDLLDTFAKYDKLAKQIHALPSPQGPGSSQDRVQTAIFTRANLFLQRKMFPLRSLPTPQSSSRGPMVPQPANLPTEVPSDIDSATAHMLQPLLEQESLLESFITEATNQRKFEDVKTLRGNLVEIRHEIRRLLEGKPS